MNNVYDYIKYYKDIVFSEIEFNEVDALILSQLVYINYSLVFSKRMKKSVLISELANYVEDNDDNKIFRNTLRLLNTIKSIKRFENIKVTNFQRILNDKTQFAGMTLILDDGRKIISYSGTDTSVIGWIEDFTLSYKYPVPAQEHAIMYINSEVSLFDGRVIIMGHSKGGNLAMTAGMDCKSYIKPKISMIYNFDGPGFLDEEFNSKDYFNMTKKLKMYVPTETFFGLVLNHTKDYKVVQSSKKGILQHDVFTWHCFGGLLVRDEISKKSIKFEETLNKFLSTMNFEERKKFIDILFSLFIKANIKDIDELKITKLDKIISLIKELTSIDKAIRDKLITIVKMMLSI